MTALLERECVFLDRDGTVIEERHYLSDPAGVEVVSGAAAGICAIRQRGLLAVIVSNQSGIGRGLFGWDDVNRVNARMLELLEVEGAQIDGLHICPHTPDDACACRKPASGLVLRAAEELGADPARSLVVGDKRSDIDLGLAVGATTVLVRTGYGAATERELGVRPDYVIDRLGDFDALLDQIGAAAAVGTP
jgi:D-glycero-D-manno-heptose 1,7-bisphosphate phosphatase